MIPTENKSIYKARKNKVIEQNHLTSLCELLVITTTLNSNMFPVLCVLSLLFTLSITITITRTSGVAPNILDVSYLNRSTFPQGFIFGTASSAYQVLYNVSITFVIFNLNIVQFGYCDQLTLYMYSEANRHA